MAEIMTNVYDILLPSPPALKEITSISIAVQLWRQEINSHRIRNTLNQLNLEQDILPDNPMPRIPATTLPLIKKYVKQVGPSIKKWLNVHSHLDVFRTEIFDDFTDFVGDFDGTIHYAKTARKMMACERIDQITRFKIACTYCFENTISQIWPSISSHFKNTSNFHGTNRVLYYWICQLNNQLYKLPRSDTDRSVEAQYFREYYFFPVWSSLKYFWNRVDVDIQTQIIKYLPESFKGHYRYLLSKFNEIQLNKFANTKGAGLLRSFLRIRQSGWHEVEVPDSRAYIMAIWTYIKHEVNGSVFASLIREIIRIEYSDNVKNNNSSLCCELWKTAPNQLKQHAIRNLPVDEIDSLFEEYPHWAYREERSIYLESSFLSIVLSDASLQDGIIFWDKYWRTLMDIMCTEQLAQLMSFCFGNDEDRIVQFKLNWLSVLQNIRTRCSRLLNNMRMEELNKFVDFCCPDEQTRKTIRCALLVEELKFTRETILKASSLRLLNDFINNAYDDVNLAAEFKTQLLSSPSTMATFKEAIASIYFYDVIFHRDSLFIDILAPSQQAAMELKRLYILVLLKQEFIISSCLRKEGEFSNFISGCLGSEDETARFKETLPVDEIVQDAIRCALNGSRSHMVLRYNCFLVEFLEWYFSTLEALEEFKARYANDDVFLRLTTKIE